MALNPERQQTEQSARKSN